MSLLLLSLILQDKVYPPQIPGARVETYKRAGDVELRLWILQPPDAAPGDRRPAVVFYFGGGWSGGTPGQFEAQARHFASRGMVALLADYRVASRHGVKAASCVADAKSAVRWIRSNAAKLGVDPAKIAAAGGSAGGHVAACTGVVPGLDEPGEDATVSSVPDALVLFNPVLVLDAGMEKRLGVPYERISPFHHAAKGAPPTLVLHGTADATVPFETAERFAKAMKEAGARCELESYAGQGHGFFNHGRKDATMYEATLRRADAFLQSLGWLAP